MTQVTKHLMAAAAGIAVATVASAAGNLLNRHSRKYAFQARGDSRLWPYLFTFPLAGLWLLGSRRNIAALRTFGAAATGAFLLDRGSHGATAYTLKNCVENNQQLQFAFLGTGVSSLGLAAFSLWRYRSPVGFRPATSFLFMVGLWSLGAAHGFELSKEWGIDQSACNK